MNGLLATLLFLQAQTLTSPIQERAIAATQKEEGSKSIMLIDPKSRAADYEEAFALLTGEKSTAKVAFHLTDGQKISNVIDMKIMPNHTIVVFRYNTAQGVMLQAVEIEAIDGIRLQ